MNHINVVAIVVGRISLGTRRNALFAIDLNAASGFPARHCRIGFKAQTYPVTREKIVTPTRPWTRIRTIGYWRNRGGAPSCDVGLKSSSSNARAIWVKTTSREAKPRRPSTHFTFSCRLLILLYNDAMRHIRHRKSSVQKRARS